MQFKQYKIFFLFSLFLLSFSVKSNAQGTSNKGTDFWFLYAPHINGYSNNAQKMSIYITSDVNTSGKIEIPSIGSTLNFTVTANKVTIVDIPQSAYSGGSEGKNNKGIHLTAIKPVVAYGHIYASSMSGATLLLPTNTLGKDYYSINFKQQANSANAYSFCAVVATEDNTQIVITPSVTTQGGLTAGVPKNITLNKGEIYQIFGKETSKVVSGGNTTTFGDDLTGTTIKSIAANGQTCKKIAVFSGSTRVSIGCLSSSGLPGSADNLFQQVYPTSTWGKTFVTVPSKDRSYDVYRVFKNSPSTVVKINGITVNPSSFVNNLFYEFNSDKVNFIEGDNSIQVVQYQVTQGKSVDCKSVSGDLGDPEMIFLNPLEQTLDKMTMYSSPFYLITKHFINVVIKTSDVASFTLDGISKASSFFAVINKPGYSYAQIQVNEGTHNLQANGGFNAIAYGYGANESYGYAAGASLISPGIESVDQLSNQKKESGCVNEPYSLFVSLPYHPLKLSADFDDGAGKNDLNIDLVDTYVLNNITYYKYKLIENKVYNIARKYVIKVSAEKPSSDGCGAVDELELEYEVLDKPMPKFEVEKDKICEGLSFNFTDKSDGVGNSIVKWYWDFGNGRTEVKTNGDSFSYSLAPGTYTVKLAIENQAGCLSESFSKVIQVWNNPVAKFQTSTALCVAQDIQFSDQSTSTDGQIIKWAWDFGDGETSTEQNPKHQFATISEFDVKLVVTTENGCQNTIQKKIKINPLPVVDFDLPDFCLSDSKAVFVNKSNISSNENLTYLWDFGDANANAQRPNTSTDKDGAHIYTQIGLYEVTLIVKSSSGCQTILKKQFRVNGSIPKADFEVLNSDKLCVGSKVQFKDLAAVDFGEITKIEWLFDADHKNTPDLVDDNPNVRSANAKIYEFTYPIFTNLISKTYTVKMRAYSGSSCVSEKTKIIMVYPLPIADFSLPSSCLNNGKAVFVNSSSYADPNKTLTYLWDFGDSNANAQNPNTSTDKDATHSYTHAGLYEVTLIVTSEFACQELIKKQFRVDASVPKVDFEVLNDNKLCSGSKFQFKDLVTLDFGELTKIEWFFDADHKSTPDLVDNNPNTRNASARIYEFTYPVFTDVLSKTYTVKMKAYSGGVCVSEHTKTIIVYALPIVDFKISTSCLPDGKAEFVNSSTFVVPNANLTYSWDFGDANANSQRPNTSLDKNPIHNYTEAGKYTVSLTVGTPYSCQTTFTKEIIIDGAVPVANFSVQNQGNLCVANPIEFKDLTTLTFGEITKIEWYYDYANYPTQVEIDNSPGARASLKSYQHIYPTFSTPFTKDFVVKMVAYSGNVCVSSIEKTITVKALPQLIFEPENEFCLYAPNIQLKAKELNNMPGVGSYSGRGVNSSGLFNPASAGVGAHVITYKFSVANGCTVEKSQTIIVNEIPVVDAGEDLVVLEGGQGQFKASAYGADLSYKWTPAIGLDKDDVLNPIIFPDDDREYTLTVTSNKGCVSIDKVFVKVLRNLIFPNTITPNGDGINDTWNIKYIESYPTVKVEVFDRNGQRVFNSIGYQKPFDGTFNGKPLPLGTYYYIITLHTKKKPLTGSLTIIR